MLLFKLGIFTFDLSSVMSFVIGIALGAIIVCLGYLLAVISSLRNKDFFSDIDETSVTKEDVKELVIGTQAAFKDAELRGDKSMIAHCKDLCFNLASTIAARFFPNSKFPLFELSVDETVKLADYIEKRVDEILDKKGIRLLRKLKISKIVAFSQKANKINNSTIFKKSKEVNEEVKNVKKVINTVNPAWWFKKIVMDKTVSAIESKICTVVIAIVAEETYKVYSKRVFDKEVEISTNVDEIMSSINSDLIEASEKKEEEALLPSPEIETAEAENLEPVIEYVDSSKPRFKSRGISLEVEDSYSCFFLSNMPGKKHETKTTNAFMKMISRMELEK